MARYIDAERLKRTFASGIRVYDGMCKIADVMHNIENEPTADVAEVKHGEWKLHPDGSGTCSCCNRTQKFVWDYDNAQNFCGHCGAKMSESPTGSERSD